MIMIMMFRLMSMERLTTEGAVLSGSGTGTLSHIFSNNPYMIMISRPMSMGGMTTEGAVGPFMYL